MMSEVQARPYASMMSEVQARPYASMMSEVQARPYASRELLWKPRWHSSGVKIQLANLSKEFPYPNDLIVSSEGVWHPSVVAHQPPWLLPSAASRLGA